MHPTLRIGLLSLYPLFIVVSFLLAKPSLRQTALFLSSFSFQTTALGWIYLYTGNLKLGRWAARYTFFVAFIWLISLGGKETTMAEWVFNCILHYVFPAITILTYVPHIGKETSNAIPGFIYPVVYVGCLFIAEMQLGYFTYPIMKDQPLLIQILWCISFKLF
jgi:hypothetical protein